MPFCLRTEMKNLDKRRSSSLAGMFSTALDSFSDSQNFFHAFKSLLPPSPRYSCIECFFYFRSRTNFSISTSSLLVLSTCFLGKVYWFFSRSKPIFSYYLFVTFGGQLLQQDRSRCRSRWGNLFAVCCWIHILLCIEAKQANMWRMAINSLLFKFLCQALLCKSKKIEP